MDRPADRPFKHHRAALEFPSYTVHERVADVLVHALGVLAAGIGGACLIALKGTSLPVAGILAVILYVVALNGTLLTSTAYHLTPADHAKEILRRLDHAMIFVLIAGTYTPFAVRYWEEGGGNGLALLAVWCTALVGMVLKLAFPRRFERLGLCLYLGLGWAMTLLVPSMWSAFTVSTIVLLAIGGALYTVGSAVLHMERIAYHNAVWHALVVAAAGCHFAAVAQGMTS